MSKRAFDVFAFLAMVIGGLGLYVLPVLRYVLLAKCIGLPGLGMLLFVEAVVGVACGVHPLRSWSWYCRRDPDDPRTTAAIVTHELANAAVAALLLALSAPWWSPIFGVPAPVWMFAPLALRAAGLAAMTTLTLQGSIIAALAVLLDALFMFPLVALVGRSLEAVVFVSTTITLMILVLAIYSPRLQYLAHISDSARVWRVADSIKASPTGDRWRLGDWLRQLGKDIQYPLAVAVAGIGIMVPLATSATLVGLMLAPFMAAAAVKPSEWFANRVIRGMLVAGLAWTFIHACGPAIYRFLLPDSFGDGALMTTLAWGSLACIPAALLGDDESEGQNYKLLAAVVGITVLVLLTARDGAAGCLLGIALAPIFVARVRKQR